MREVLRLSCEAMRGLALSLGFLVAGSGVALPQFPTEPPPSLELRPLEFPPFQEARLSNGLTLLVVENHRLPIVSVRLSMLAGSRSDPESLEGVASLTASLLTKGTERRTAEQIAEEIEGVGASLFASAGDDFFNIYTTVLTEHVDLAFDLVSDVLLNATFPEDELELERTRTLSSLKLEKSSPGALASRYFMKMLYGDHPYGRSATEESVESITRETVQSYAATYLKPEGGLLVISGDISLNDAKRLAERYLSSWTGAPPAAGYPAPPKGEETRILLVHRPGSAQSNIRVGNLALRAGADTYYPATVANKILGGGTDARLFMILREQKSWTYGAYSGISRRKDIGYFRANTEVRNEVTDSALTELLHQLERIRTEAVADSELTAAKGYLIGSFPLSIETPQQIAGQVANVKLLGLPDDYLQTYRERLAAVSADQAMAAAREVIKSDSLAIVVVGDGKAIYDGLAAIAAVSIIDVDGNPLTPADLTPEAVAVELDRSQITARIDSFQVTMQGNPVGTMVTEIATEGGDIVVTQSFSIPMAGMQQDGKILLDATTLEVKSRDETGSMMGQSVETHLTYEAGRVTGTAQEPGPAGVTASEVDTTVASGTLDSEALQALVFALPLEEGASITVNSFDAAEGTVKPITVKVAGTEEITVPAGTFQAFKLDITGDEPLTVYVSHESPRRVLKIEVVGQPIAIELVSGGQ